MKCPICSKKIKPVEKIYCTCKCGTTFCSAHKTPADYNSNTTHKCEYNYVEDFKKYIEMKNPRIEVDKIGERV